MSEVFQIHPIDNVAVALQPLTKGDTVLGVTALEDIPYAHKVALRAVSAGEAVMKYGYPIGRATCAIEPGAHVHTHNMASALSGTSDYSRPDAYLSYTPEKAAYTFSGYLRPDGRAGIRNDIWILPTVGCANQAALQFASAAQQLALDGVSGVYAFTHPYGCSQLGEDMANTQKILAGLAKNPNAAGVLLVSLGCENNNLDAMRPFLEGCDAQKVRCLVLQQSDDEVGDALRLLKELATYAATFKRQDLPLSMLTIGMKCGGSDALSGITANPLCGQIADLLTSSGGRCMLSEVPEMFGAEQILLNRCTSAQVFDAAAGMIGAFKQNYVDHGVPVYENPSPGNRAGGITTLEEKSLGCVQKGGRAAVTDVLAYGAQCQKPGLSLLSGPGNDMVSTTALTAAGAVMLLFTTGRGTPLGAPVPTLKLASGTAIAEKKPGWIDFDCAAAIHQGGMTGARDALLDKMLQIAAGQPAKNEAAGYREIAILRGGVTL